MNDKPKILQLNTLMVTKQLYTQQEVTRTNNSIFCTHSLSMSQTSLFWHSYVWCPSWCGPAVVPQLRKSHDSPDVTLMSSRTRTNVFSLTVSRTLYSYDDEFQQGNTMAQTPH